MLSVVELSDIPMDLLLDLRRVSAVKDEQDWMKQLSGAEFWVLTKFSQYQMRNSEIFEKQFWNILS
jgi:hypothetical protein